MSGLTIGMAVVDDTFGVWSTIQSMRMYHAEIADKLSFVVINNNPNGPYTKGLHNFSKKVPRCRVIDYSDKTSTSVRDQVFRHSETDYTLCCDSHIFIKPKGLARLIQYYERNPDTKNLLQGPMLYDELSPNYGASHFNIEWSDHMCGTWGSNPDDMCDESTPFEIPAQGLGLFTCRTDAWLGFNPAFRGFGGEEVYIHQKFRNAGHKTLCLPFLGWAHYFRDDKEPAKYNNNLVDRAHNYFVGWDEVGLPIKDVYDNFVERLGVTRTKQIQREALEIRAAQKKAQEKTIPPPTAESLSDQMKIMSSAANQLAPLMLTLPPSEQEAVFASLDNELLVNLVKAKMTYVRNQNGT